MELVKVTCPQLLDDSFWVLEAGAEALNWRCRDKWFAPRMYADVLNGIVDLYLVQVCGDTVGFAMTSVEDGAFMINATYIEPGTKGADIRAMAVEALRTAGELGAKEVRLKTLRDKGFLDVLSPLGFETAHVELVAEVPYG